MFNPGTLYIISAPSGAGKTSLIKKLVALTTNLQVAVSYTTRAQRSSEQDGVDYNFVSHAVFDAMIQHQDFLEYATVFGNHYGSAKSWIQQRLAKGIDLILEIDWQGAQQIVDHVHNVTSIFILPPSKEILQQRLQSRAEDNAHTISERMQRATSEMSHYKQYDFVVLNDDFAIALEDICAIIKATRLRRQQQQAKHELLFAALLR